MAKTYGVIMAGGGGTRFWPLSRNKTPKQLLNLSGKDVMINETFNRINKVCDNDGIFVVTNAVQANSVKDVMKGKITPDNVLAEPCAKNTSACIGLAAVKILKEKGDGVMIVTPSDAYIKDEEKYAKILSLAVETAKNSDDLVTIGIKPTFPATGYGYINFEKTDNEVKKVKKFVEKPNKETAEKYVESGDYVWNSGVFIWKASVIMENFKKYLPDIYDKLQIIFNAIGTEKENSVIEKAYSEMQSISIDYGVMEKSENVSVIVGDFGWNDVGSFDMLEVLHKKDEDGNVKIGDVYTVNTENSVIYSSTRTVATVGLNNIVVVETPDAILVIDKSKVQDVKAVVEKLKQDNRTELL